VEAEAEAPRGADLWWGIGMLIWASIWLAGHRLEESREDKDAEKKRKCIIDISLLHSQEKPFCQTFS
jgi:hypothetical protein